MIIWSKNAFGVEKKNTKIFNRIQNFLGKISHGGQISRSVPTPPSPSTAYLWSSWLSDLAWKLVTPLAFDEVTRSIIYKVFGIMLSDHIFNGIMGRKMIRP